MPKELAPHPPLPEFHGAPEERPRWVRALFDRTAHDYDWMNRVLSFGTGARYRRQTLEAAGVTAGRRVLDIATGTGLVAGAALELGVASRDLVGLDPSFGMLRENRNRRGIPLVSGIGEALPFTDASFDFVTMGYALRHVADLVVLFSECRRVLKQGGKLLVLEVTAPTSRAARAVLGAYLGGLAPTLALLRRDQDLRQLFRYYWATIDQCVPPATILGALAQAGFERPDRSVEHVILSQYAALR